MADLFWLLTPSPRNAILLIFGPKDLAVQPYEVEH